MAAPLALDPVIVAVARVGLAGVLAAAAFHKLRDPRAYATIVNGYRLIPEGLGTTVSLVLGALECAVVAALLWQGVVGAFGAGALLVLYSGAIGINLLRGRRDIDCGCSGAGHGQRLSPWLLGRNALLAGVAWLCAFPVTSRSPGWLDGVTVIAAGGALVLLYAAAGRLAATASPVRFERIP